MRVKRYSCKQEKMICMVKERSNENLKDHFNNHINAKVRTDGSKYSWCDTMRITHVCHLAVIRVKLHS